MAADELTIPTAAKTRRASGVVAGLGLLGLVVLTLAWALWMPARAASYALTPASGPAGTVVHFQASGLGLGEAYCLEMDGQVLWLGAPPATAVDIPFTIPAGTPEGAISARFFACAQPETVLAELTFTVTADPTPGLSPSPTATPTLSTPGPTQTPGTPVPPAPTYRAFIPGLSSD